MLAVATTGCCMGPRLGHPAHHREFMQVPVLSARGIEIDSKTCVIVSLGLRFEMVSIILTFRERLVCSVKYEVCCVVLVSL